MSIIQAVAVAYIVATLAATGLAKLKNFRVTSAGIGRESVIPTWASKIVAIGTALIELALALLFTLAVQPRLVGLAGTALFLVFGGYQLLVAAKTNSLMCSCSGAERTDPASLPAVAGTVFACLFQAALSLVLALSVVRPSMIFHGFAIVALSVPVITFFIGARRKTGESGVNGRFWLVF
jgi:hypothetical protein